MIPYHDHDGFFPKYSDEISSRKESFFCLLLAVEESNCFTKMNYLVKADMDFLPCLPKPGIQVQKQKTGYKVL